MMGVGGAGVFCVAKLVENPMREVDCIVLDVDSRNLEPIKECEKLLLAPNIAHGIGTGRRRGVGVRVALAEEERLKELLMGREILFLVIGLAGGLGAGILMVFCLWIAFLPLWIARVRKHPHSLAIFLINLLLGWTLLFWLVALIWAFVGKEEK